MLKSALNILKNTEWETLTDFVSPAFFDVVPTIGMVKVIKTLTANYADRRKYKEALTQASAALSPTVGIQIGFARPTADQRNEQECIQELSSRDQKTALGQTVLEIYFAQLFTARTCLLDLRLKSFKIDQLQAVSWEPGPIYYTWDSSFQTAIQQMYCGFYQQDDHSFSSGLRALNLEHAEVVFRKHFGVGEQSQVEFKLQDFKKSFHAIFLACKERKTRLHPDFFALGVYLLCLYENLEKIGVPLNARQSFLKATTRP